MSEEEDIFTVYERSERLVSIVTKIDMALRILMAMAYVAMISEITGIPMVRIAEYIVRYFQVMPSLLEPYRVQIFLSMLVLDTIDIIFGNLLVRIGGVNYIKSVSAVSFVLGVLTFCGYPFILIFICFALPKALALYVVMSHPDAVKAMVKLYEEGTFE